MNYIKIFRNKVEEKEGRVNHMYQDTEGNITVGIGYHITEASAKTYPFVLLSDKSKATQDQISEDYTSVHSAPGKMDAKKYKKYTKLILQEKSIDTIFERLLRSFISELRRLFKNFDQIPHSARAALLDLIYNMGMTRLNKWDKLKNAIKCWDFEEAAKESNRAQVNEERNKWVKSLLLEAAKENKRRIKNFTYRAKIQDS